MFRIHDLGLTNRFLKRVGMRYSCFEDTEFRGADMFCHCGR